jgi:hypothetical protein
LAGIRPFDWHSTIRMELNYWTGTQLFDRSIGIRIFDHSTGIELLNGIQPTDWHFNIRPTVNHLTGI